MISPAASGEWVALPLATPVALVPGTYWLGMITGDTSMATVHFVGTSPASKVFIWDAYSNGPAATADPPTVVPGPISVYAEYLSATATSTTNTAPTTTSTTTSSTTSTSVTTTTCDHVDDPAAGDDQLDDDVVEYRRRRRPARRRRRRDARVVRQRRRSGACRA